MSRKPDLKRRRTLGDAFKPEVLVLFLSLCVWARARARKRAFIAGVVDDQGFGWAIAKALSAAGAEILVNLGMPRDLLLLF
jgi:hypothetical protein